MGENFVFQSKFKFEKVTSDTIKNINDGLGDDIAMYVLLQHRCEMENL